MESASAASFPITTPLERKLFSNDFEDFKKVRKFLEEVDIAAGWRLDSIDMVSEIAKRINIACQSGDTIRGVSI